MTELRHLQLVILGIMKDIDALCVKNNIEYYLLGGSAIGAIRHKGFIPWDDDLDIIMDAANYQKFIAVCREELNQEKYVLQEGEKDWSLPFSKVRLKGTKLVELEGCADEVMQGIFVDVFKMDNAPSPKILQRWQYFCGKVYLSYTLSQRTYKSASFKKKIMMFFACLLKIKCLRSFFKRQVEKYNDKQSEFRCFLYGRTKLKNSFTKISVYGKPLRVPFESLELPVPEKYDEYLTQMFGDYMKLPPVEQRQGLHCISVDFGEY
ncbi:MAG: LicD family protein [Rikenellaceae bacterium]|nr:LicD family protein [Rikenellaceae bacterium]